MQTIELNKKVASIEVQGDKIIINLEQKYIPKDGEYFYVVTKSGYEFVVIKRDDEVITSQYASYSPNAKDLSKNPSTTSYCTCSDSEIKEIRPATKEEKDLLNKALEKRGEKWNPETKQIEALPKVGDFCIFWGNAKSMARCGILSEVASDGLPYRINYGPYFKNCIPFQSDEHFKAFINET